MSWVHRGPARVCPGTDCEEGFRTRGFVGDDPSSPQYPVCVVAHLVLRRCEGELPLEDSAVGVESGVRQTPRRAVGPLSEKGSPH